MKIKIILLNKSRKYEKLVFSHRGKEGDANFRVSLQKRISPTALYWVCKCSDSHYLSNVRASYPRWLRMKMSLLTLLSCSRFFFTFHSSSTKSSGWFKITPEIALWLNVFHNVSNSCWYKTSTPSQDNGWTGIFCRMTSCRLLESFLLAMKRLAPRSATVWEMGDKPAALLCAKMNSRAQLEHIWGFSSLSSINQVGIV